MSNPFFEKKVRRQKHPGGGGGGGGGQINAEAVSHILIIPYYVNIANIRHRTTSTWKGQASIGHPFPIN